MMQPPEFWQHDSALSRFLEPLGALWGGMGRLRHAWLTPQTAPIPVLCVGNVGVGGAGKTPVVSDLLQRVAGSHALLRGYGGSEAGPHRVSLEGDSMARVGDEALCLAEIAPVWVSRDRVAGARAAAAAGASVVIMDDGFQNPSLRKDRSLLVIDGAYGFGNGKLLPAGPLRESPERAFARADGVVVLGDAAVDEAVDEAWWRGVVPATLPLLRAHLQPDPAVARRLQGQRVVAFAGIGRPQKFFETLRGLGATVVRAYPFADHYPYAPSDIQPILDEAYGLAALPVTTAKDAVRLTADQRQQVDVLPVTVQWHEESLITQWLGALKT